ncbi:hypothetical protein WJX74_007354 [Apatococcus lobatus]|uniref:Alfin N-terminal domain-containing protein n=1 Tax=Apatococcus lobatus TaxID=904363 RepID=A0AAW1QXU9_9CHLO
MSVPSHPKSVDEIFQHCRSRREGLLRALTEEAEQLAAACSPERENLCLYGETDGSWVVDLPAEEVPPELPEPCLGINFARDGMQRSDWLALVAVHSDAWLYSVAFFFGTKLEKEQRAGLFQKLNEYPSLYEVVTGAAKSRSSHAGSGQPSKRRRVDMGSTSGAARASESPLPTGRLLTASDISASLKGRQAELFWPADKMWYLVEIHSVGSKNKSAKVQYTSGEFEELDLEETIREGHMSLITR